MSNVVEFNAARADAAQKARIETLQSRITPAGEQKCFTVGYVIDGEKWAFDLWAPSEEDAKRRIAAIRESAELFYSGFLNGGVEPA